MAKYTINKRQLKESIQAVISEAIDAYGISGDYINDMQNLADTTGEEMDDAFLDSVAQYDGRDGNGGPVYPDRKNSEMNADWFNDDYEAKDSQAQYGYNAERLDNLDAFSDTVDDYLNDINYNQYDNSGADVLGSEWDKAEAEREHPMESMIRRAVKQSISEVIKGRYDNPQHPDDFSEPFGTAAHKFAHDGVDAYWARKDQDKMEKKEKNSMKRNTKRSMNAADKRQLHRKGSLNRAFDESKQNSLKLESKIYNIVKKTLAEAYKNNDDAAFWKQQQEDEMNYDMREFTKAMQKAKGTYHAKSSDGQFQTGDRVIVHGRTQDIEGIITDFGTNLMTWKENCDVDYVKDGKTFTLMGVPLNKIEKLSTNESRRKNKMKNLNEEWYPDSDEGMDDYYYGAMMTLNVDGVFDELTPEKVEELNNIGKNGDGPYIENSQNYSNVMVTKVNVTPDGFDGYDITVEVAVSSPDMPIDAIEEEVEDMVWYWIEEQTGVRSPRVYITDEKEVFDRRSHNK